MLKKFFIFSLLSLMAFGSDFGKIATGSSTGTYIKIGKDLKNLFEEYKIKLDVVETNGSGDNLNLLTSEKEKSNIYWAVIQKDALKYYDYRFPKKELEKKVKLIFPIYNETIHVFIKKGKNLNLKEGRNYKVAVNSKSGGSYITAQYLSSAYHLKFDYIFENNIANIEKMLSNDKLDMFIAVMAQGNKTFAEFRNVDLLELENNFQFDTYKKITISKNTYPWLTKDKSLYSVPSVIATNVTEKENDESIEAFIKIMLANYRSLQKIGNPKWKEINFRYFDDIDDTYHSKAVETFKQLGLIK